MSLSDQQKNDVDDRVELGVRRYFDTYLQEILPAQLKAERHHNHLMIERHDASNKAHGGVEAKVLKAKWMIAGAVAVGGAGAAGLAKLIGSIL